MNSFLKQSTASQSRAIGPFIDDTDFKTAETGLTIANTDIQLVVNGGASANKNSGGGTHRANGVYGITFDATDTATVGEILVSVVVAGALPVFHTFTVVEEAVYDMLFGASAVGYVANAPVNVAQFGGSNLTASGGIPAVNATQINGTAQTARDIGASVLLSSGTGTGQVSLSSGLVRLSATGVDDILDEVVESTYTMRQMLRLFGAALAGTASGLGTTTATYVGVDGTTNRLVATVDADGNRTAVTKTAT